ncbi:hypothetical protein [Yunchengibacter salinarum]|uniref:hypothetical protein n=1 Tax=Yunchengibacter salinarum TaxID=3133399 RepID=UPI0035B61DA8
MTRPTCGEARLTLPDGSSATLRLDIGTMMDIEDWFDTGLVPLLTHRLPQGRLGDMAVFLAAMLGRDFAQKPVRREMAALIRDIGLVAVADAIALCLERTLLCEDRASGSDARQP